jgi:hypothetical protein
MALLSISQIIKRKSGGRGSITVDGLTFSVDRSKSSRDGITRYAIRLRLGADVVKESRMIDGDRVDLLIDKDDQTGLLKRVSVGGWKICSTNNRKGAKVNSLILKLGWAPGLPYIAKTSLCDQVSVTNEGILFRFPSGTVFDTKQMFPTA